MVKYLKNFTRANHELKVLEYNCKLFSSFFSMISYVITRKIE